VSMRGCWAIVGGAVRDTLLDPSPVRQLLLAWPDIDVAVTARERLTPRMRRLDESGTRVVRNTFGGWKVFSSAVGVCDVWSWGRRDLKHPRGFWQARLESVDFGLNAVAFVWPERRVIVHPRWREDLAGRVVEKLSQQSRLRELQVVRAVA